jgi:hypothetical protein
MDITKKAVVEPPKNPPQPIKAQPQSEQKVQHQAATPGCCQPQPKA